MLSSIFIIFGPFVVGYLVMFVLKLLVTIFQAYEDSERVRNAP